jgi:DNA-binding NarL/FixJ family response regulator
VTTRVLLCDDQALVRSGFRMILEARPEFEVVGEAEDGRRAIELARRLLPDVILMDVRMPVLDGVEATRRLVEGGSAARVLILTTYDVDEYVYEAIRAGASGFLLKDVRPDQLAEAIRVVAQGDALLAPSVTRRLLDRFAETLPGAVDARPRADLSALSERELQILRLLAGGCRTPSSPASSFSARRRSRATSRASSASSACATACRRSSWPTRPVSSGRARRTDHPGGRAAGRRFVLEEEAGPSGRRMTGPRRRPSLVEQDVGHEEELRCTPHRGAGPAAGTGRRSGRSRCRD